jgi:uncharacterized membrane protein (DUF485 family)
MFDRVLGMQYSAPQEGRGKSGERRFVERHEEWVRIERTSAFSELTQKRKGFIIPATIFFLVFYFGLPVLAAFTTVLNFTVVGAITGAYVYAFAQFAMTWILMHLYVSRANGWDDLVDRARQQAAEEETAEGRGA